jgi:hypothetical protein
MNVKIYSKSIVLLMCLYFCKICNFIQSDHIDTDSERRISSSNQLTTDTTSQQNNLCKVQYRIQRDICATTINQIVQNRTS